MKNLLLAFTCLTLGACATMDAAECRSANWYDLGFRDGLHGIQRMDFVYAEQCGKHGAQPDAAAYGRGWQEGVWELDSRRNSGSPD